MASSAGSAPSWLFSFVDLAFLLLIAMTQIGGEQALELGEIIVPRIQDKASNELPTGADDAWQLRVHPPDPDAPGPFELVQGSAAAQGPLEILDRSGLQARLDSMHEAGVDKPILAPHQDSRSQDLLDAVDLIEERWPGRRRATVSPTLAQR